MITVKFNRYVIVQPKEAVIKTKVGEYYTVKYKEEIFQIKKVNSLEEGEIEAIYFLQDHYGIVHLYDDKLDLTFGSEQCFIDEMLSHHILLEKLNY